ncbi:hypothetical protein M5585_21225 [Serratia ureilytica]
MGRIDAKAHRRRGVRDHQLSCGAAGALRQTAGQDIRQAIARMAKWHGAQRVALGDIPAALAAEWGAGWEVG